jgi:hypothetical protein
MLERRKVYLLGGVVVVFILIGGYLLRGGGSEVPTFVEDVPTSSIEETYMSNKDSIPVFLQIDDLKDPFTKKSLRQKELEMELEIKKKEIELLKAQIEELKLQREMEKYRGHRSAKNSRGLPTPKLIAIVQIGGKSKVYLSIGGKRVWLREGESYGSYRVESIGDRDVVLNVKGRRIELKLKRVQASSPSRALNLTAQKEGQK